MGGVITGLFVFFGVCSMILAIAAYNEVMELSEEVDELNDEISKANKRKKK